MAKARRKRKRIPLIEIAASALADKLPRLERDRLRAEIVPAKTILRMFTPDHITLHCWGGDDRWWNLDMRQRGPELKAKDAADTSRAAKSVRIEEKWSAFTRAMAKGIKPVKRRSAWPRKKRRK